MLIKQTHKKSEQNAHCKSRMFVFISFLLPCTPTSESPPQSSRPPCSYPPLHLLLSVDRGLCKHMQVESACVARVCSWSGVLRLRPGDTGGSGPVWKHSASPAQPTPSRGKTRSEPSWKCSPHLTTSPLPPLWPDGGDGGGGADGDDSGLSPRPVT